MNESQSVGRCRRAAMGAFGATLLLCATMVRAATLEVTVLDVADDKPLPGAKLEIGRGEATIEWYADANGKIRIVDLDSGRYTMKVSMATFKTEYQELDLSGETTRVSVRLQEFRRVSMLQLLATPDRYDGLPVLVFGYCSVGFEDDALYFHKEDWVHGIRSNALRIEFDPATRDERCDRKYVALRGLFSGSRTGGLYGGTIHSIETMSILESRAE